MAPCKSQQRDDPKVKSDHCSAHTSVSSNLPSQIQRTHSAMNKNT